MIASAPFEARLSRQRAAIADADLRAALIVVDHPHGRRAMPLAIAQPEAAQLLDRQLLRVGPRGQRQTGVYN
jgi:hypothetical protein